MLWFRLKMLVKLDMRRWVFKFSALKNYWNEQVGWHCRLKLYIGPSYWSVVVIFRHIKKIIEMDKWNDTVGWNSLYLIWGLNNLLLNFALKSLVITYNKCKSHIQCLNGSSPCICDSSHWLSCVACIPSIIYY